MKKEQHRQIITNFVLIGAFCGCFYFIFLFLKKNKEYEDEYANNQVGYLLDDALRMQGEAAQLLNQNQIEAAINRLIIAEAMDPDNDLIKQDLASAYLANCQANDLNCEEALFILSTLISKYPSDAKLYDERSKVQYAIGDTAAFSRDIKKAQELKLDNLIEEKISRQ